MCFPPAWLIDIAELLEPNLQTPSVPQQPRGKGLKRPKTGA